jgi:hypothetical protein
MFQGTLHFHLVFYGGLSPYLLQRFADLKNLCDAITEALDKMYTARVKLKTHAAILTHKILQESNVYGLNPSTLGPAVPKEPLLSRPRPLDIIVDGKLPLAVLDAAVDEQAARQENHSHMKTCRTSFLGLTGCRLCMPGPARERTGPVRLVAASAAARDRLEENLPEADSEAGSSDGDFSDSKEDPVESPERPGPKVDDPYAYEVQSIPDNPASRFYHHHDPLDNSVKDWIIVWEICRPTLRLVSDGDPGVGSDNVEGANGDVLSRQTMVARLRSILLDGSPAYDSNSSFWQWLDRLDDNRLSTFYQDLADRLEKANGYIAAYNAATSYCTGSHNNYLLLGSQDQAKSAIYYICPYMGKTKYPLMHSLAVLQLALDHVEKHKSVAADTGSDQRTAKHVLTRVLNQMNLCMEKSDYQAAACLAHLPTHFSGTKNAYGNPTADHAYSTLVQVQEDSQRAHERMITFLNCEQDELERQQDAAAGGAMSDFIVDDADSKPPAVSADHHEAYQFESYNAEDLKNLQDIGFLQLVTMRDPSEDRNKDIRMLIPSASLYGSRGAELRNLNRLEFRSLVGTRRAKADNSRGHIRQFLIPPPFAIAAQYAFVLEGKQCTPILTRSSPPHPGAKPNHPDDHPTCLQWKKDADIFAKYWLSELRPETDCYQVDHQNRLAYDWTALSEWVESCLHSDRIIDTFRLMAMEKRRIGLRSSYVHKVWLSKYRARNRDLWSSDQKARFAMEDTTRRKGYAQNVLDQYSFEQEHRQLSRRTQTQLSLQLASVNAVADEYKSLRSSRALGPITTPLSDVVYMKKSIKEIQQLQAELRALQVPAAKRKRNEDYEEYADNPIALAHHMSSKFSTNPRQQELFDFYAKYLLQPKNPACQPPDIVLVHGMAGTGKSYVADCINDLTTYLRKNNVRTAFNAINANAIGGNTTASLVQLRPEIHSEHLIPLNIDQLKKFKLLSGIDEDTMLIFIEEGSTQAPYHLARLNMACQQATGCNTCDFGGLKCVILADLNQLGPVKAGPSLTEAVIEYYSHLAEKNKRPSKLQRKV